MIPHHTFVGAEQAPHLAFLMHGVLGSGHNLRSVAKRLQGARPDYRFVLIDLRYHGQSLGAPPPHELEACADDLIDLAGHLGQAPRVVIGHSMGGKVALAYGRRQEVEDENPQRRAATTATRETLRQVWTLDSDPGAQDPQEGHQVLKVIRALLRHTGPFSSRSAAHQALTGEGLSAGLAHWLNTNLERKPDGFHWRFEMDHISELLRDYFSLDFWTYVQKVASGELEGSIRYELLLAEQSDRWSGAMRERAEQLDGGHRVRVHRLADSGHWVHVDNPDGLHEVLTAHLI